LFDFEHFIINAYLQSTVYSAVKPRKIIFFCNNWDIFLLISQINVFPY